MIAWDEMFMRICATVQQRSKDPSTRVGACVADARHALVSAGFNGPPRGASDVETPWDRPEKYAWVVHAEENALLFALAAVGRYMLDGCTLYSSAVVCSKCLLLAAHLGIRRVVESSRVPAVCVDDRKDAKNIVKHFGMEIVRWNC